MHDLAGLDTLDEQLAARDEVALPGARRAVVQVPGVAGRREVEAAVGGRRVDSPGDDVVLERRLPEVDDVVDDDVRPGRAQRLDVLGEPRLATERRREVQLGPRREVVHDLQHRRALVALPRLTRQHRHPGRQVARRLPLGQAVGAVRQHADADARAVDPEGAPRRVRPVGGVAFRGVLPAGRRSAPRVGAGSGREPGRLPERHRLVGGADRPHRIHPGQGLEGGQRELGPDGAVAGHAADDRAVQLADARQHRRRHLGSDVHEDPVGIERRVRGKLPGLVGRRVHQRRLAAERQVERRRLAVAERVQLGPDDGRLRVGRPPAGQSLCPPAARRAIQQPRAELALRRRAPRLGREQRRDLGPGARRDRRRACRGVPGGRRRPDGRLRAGDLRDVIRPGRVGQRRHARPRRRDGRPGHAGPGRRTLRVRQRRRRFGQETRRVGPAVEAEAPPARRLPALVQRRRDPQQADPRLDAATAGHRRGRGRAREVAGAARRHRGGDRRQQSARDSLRLARTAAWPTATEAWQSRRCDGWKAGVVDEQQHAGTGKRVRAYGRRSDELPGQAEAEHVRPAIPGSHLRSTNPRLHRLAPGDHQVADAPSPRAGHGLGKTAPLTWNRMPVLGCLSAIE